MIFLWGGWRGGGAGDCIAPMDVAGGLVSFQPKSAKQDILLVAHVEPSNSYFAYQLEAERLFTKKMRIAEVSSGG